MEKSKEMKMNLEVGLMSKGIDVSAHQGNINWDAVKASGIDFAIIRISYGQNSVDSKAIRNIEECIRVGMPFGVYTYSYALNINNAINEANLVIKTLAPYKDKVKFPVIIDMAENYPAMIEDTWTFRGPNLFDYVIRNPMLLRKLEKWIIPRLDGVWVVSEASRRRVLEMTGERNPIWIVGNTPRLIVKQEIKFQNSLAYRLPYLRDIGVLPNLMTAY